MRGVLRFLDNDSPFGRICGFLGTLIAANLMFVVSLIPVITAGAGLCGLYYTMLKLVRYKEVNPFETFWQGFRDNFKRATLTALGIAVLGVILVLDLRISAQMPGLLHYYTTVLYGVLIVVAVLAIYLFPVMAAFEGNMRELLKLSVYFAGGNLPGTLMIAVLYVVPMLLTYSNRAMLPLAAFLWCLCGFAVIAFCSSMILMRRFRRHLEPLAHEVQAANERKILEEMRRLDG